MALIDVTLERPALNRREVIETEASGAEAGIEREVAAPTEPKPSRRGRHALGAVGAVAVGVSGLLTLRKLRARRKNRGAE